MVGSISAETTVSDADRRCIVLVGVAIPERDAEAKLVDDLAANVSPVSPLEKELPHDGRIIEIQEWLLQRGGF